MIRKEGGQAWPFIVHLVGLVCLVGVKKRGLRNPPLWPVPTDIILPIMSGTSLTESPKKNLLKFSKDKNQKLEMGSNLTYWLFFKKKGVTHLCCFGINL